MKLTAFEANKGDAILIEGHAGTTLLVDGGHVNKYQRVDSYHANIAPHLSALRQADRSLDLVCVSHIDQDHIGGVLSMLNDEFDWRVFDHQQAQGLDVAEPHHPRPPEISEIWHNAFHLQVGLNRGDLEDALAAAGPLAATMAEAPLSHGEELFGRLAHSMREAAMVSRRIDPRQLNIPLNDGFGGGLVLRTEDIPVFEYPELTVSVLGPSAERLEDLRKDWNKWLESTRGARQVARLLRDARDDDDALAAGDFERWLDLADLGPAVGRRSSVTEANIASIVMMVEEGDTSVLLTGDARDDHIVDDLIASGYADDDGHAHVSVLKVQHHGSEANFSLGFAQHVTADHYLFSGNGGHHNPDLGVVEALLLSRLGDDNERSTNPQTNDPFTLWFTSDGTTYKADEDHMKEVVKLVKSFERQHRGKFKGVFSRDSSLSLTF